MASKTNTLGRAPLTVRFGLWVVVIIALSLGVFNLVMRPPLGVIGQMAGFLSITAVISSLAGYGAYRLGWMNRSPTLRWTLMAGYGLSTLLTFLNVGLAAIEMFASDHDLLLAGVLLVFSGGIAMALGYFFSSALADRIQQLDVAAGAIARGNLSVRIPIQGKDELAVLANTFNTMASQLQEAAQKQKEVEKLRRDLISWVSHDLHTPLASIQAIVEALEDGVVKDPEERQRYLQTARREARSLSLLIDDLLQMAQVDAGGLALQCEPVAFSDLISDTLESFTGMAKSQGVHLEGEAEPGLGLVSMDVPRIGRVLGNLVGNALRHTPPGGLVRVRAYREKESVRVDITDTGEGIRPEDLPYVFEQFFRGEKSRNRTTGGAGLGLAIARGFVEAHGGQIWVKSSPGQGSCFSFTLPG